MGPPTLRIFLDGNGERREICTGLDFGKFLPIEWELLFQLLHCGDAKDPAWPSMP